MLAGTTTFLGTVYTQEEMDLFVTLFNRNGQAFAQDIVDYCLENYASYGAVDFASSAALWGFDGVNDAEEFWNAIVEHYNGDINRIDGEAANFKFSEKLFSDPEFPADFNLTVNTFWHYVDNEPTIWEEDEGQYSLGLEYQLINNDTEYEVTGKGSCSDTEIVIPSTYNNKPVTSIGGRAFFNCSSLTSVTIPDGVTCIGADAFYNCSSLTSVTIPDSVANIGRYAFYNCSSLTSITIGNGVTSIGEWAFSACINLTSITIPDSVTSIGYEAFHNCSSLTSIKFNGTKEQWNKISKGYNWRYNVPSNCEIECTDGVL